MCFVCIVWQQLGTVSDELLFHVNDASHMNVSNGLRVRIYICCDIWHHIGYCSFNCEYTFLLMYVCFDIWYVWFKYDLGQKYDLISVWVHDLQFMTVHFMSLRRLPHKCYILDSLFICELMRSECLAWLLFTTTIMMCFCRALGIIQEPISKPVDCCITKFHNSKYLKVGTLIDMLLKVIQCPSNSPYKNVQAFLWCYGLRRSPL